MKIPRFINASVIAFALLIFGARVSAQSISMYFPALRVPPANGMFVQPSSGSGMSPDGVMISNLILRVQGESFPPPPPGTSLTSTFPAQVDFDYKPGPAGALTHGSVAGIIGVLISARAGSGGQQIYDTEMLQLTLSGNLPGVMIRESPTLPSAGQIMVQPGAGGFQMNSFFDIFFDVSTDGGQSWKPIDPPQHVDLRINPETVPGVAEPTALFPPPDDQLAMAPGQVLSFTGGVRLRGLRHSRFTQGLDASQIPVGATPLLATFGAQHDFELSLDGGQSYLALRTSGSVAVAVQKIRATPGHLFDTELLQLSLTAAIPGGAVMIRESPTLPSYGGASFQGTGNNQFRANSFFDVFFELSLDGGQTWRPALNGAARLQDLANGPRTRFPSQNLPPPGGQYTWPPGTWRSYATGGAGIVVSNFAFSGFSTSAPPPGVGQQLVQTLTGQVSLALSLDGGLNFTSVTTTATAALQTAVIPNLPAGSTAFYDTELLQLDLSGLPAGVMLRESPTLPSPGRLSITPDSGGYRIDSFFDIFTELSADGGQSWHPSTQGQASSALHPVPIESPVKIFCPANITAYATDSSGAVVTFLPLTTISDCPMGGVGSSCSIPSGSLFPIGTTTVTCEAHDACGGHDTCSFQVTVRPSFYLVSNYVFNQALWPPMSSEYLTPAYFGAAAGAGLTLSNVVLHNFSRNASPPQPGSSLTLSLGLTVDLDWSLDGGGSFSHGSAPATLLVNLQDLGPGSDPGQELHAVQVHRLDFSGGDLPAGLMLRASPDRSSTGQIGVQLLPQNGGAVMGSFFDVFMDFSSDQGKTWAPLQQALHLELRQDPQTQTLVPEFAPLWPPPTDRFAARAGDLLTFTGGVRLRNFRQVLFSQAFDASLLQPNSVPAVQHLTAQTYLEWSLDGGVTFTSGGATAVATVGVLKAREAAVHVFDTEMLQLDISGGDLPVGLMIRESPTLASRGQIGLEPLSDGTFTMSSFFDVFVQLSTDGGQTWLTPTSGPLHLDLEANSLRTRFGSQNFPPIGGRFQWPEGAQQIYQWGTAGIIIAGNTIGGLSPALPPPATGQTQNQEFTGSAKLLISLDGGKVFNPYTGQAFGQMRVSSNGSMDSSNRRYFDTEMLQLNISGGNLPTGLLIRESPSRPSAGRASLLLDLQNMFRIDSFFDIFTELSLDGGQSWSPTLNGPVASALNPDTTPPFAPYAITCPSNISVIATGPSGAVVNYSLPPIIIFPDCPLCCFSATCVPPSGSVFPIGTTTVHCTGHDGCGETPTCSFTVTVTQPFIYAGLVEALLGNAILHALPPGSNAPSSLVVSNLGPGGADGFHLNVNAADSVAFNFLPFPTSVNTCIVTHAYGPYALVPGQLETNHLLGTCTYLGGTNPVVSADFTSIGATSVVFQVRDEKHHLVSAGSLASAATVNINSLFPPGCTNPTTTVYTYWQGPDFAWYRFCRYGCNCIGTNCYVERTVCLRPDLVDQFHPKSLSGLDLFSQGVNVPSTLTIQRLDLGRFGNLHQPLGDANFESEADALLVNNIGASGQDGVAIGLNHVGQFDLTLAPTRLLAPNACLNLSPSGDPAGLLLPAVQFGNLSLMNSGGGLLLNGNFSPLGATAVLVEFFQGSQLQGGITMPAGALGKLLGSANLIGAGTFIQPTPGIWVRFDAVVTHADNPNLAGDEVRIRAANPTSSIHSLTGLDLHGCQIGQLAILQETAAPFVGNVTRMLNGGVLITGQGVPGQRYRLEAIPALDAQSSWRTAASAEADFDGYFELQDNTTASQQFYRTVTP